MPSICPARSAFIAASRAGKALVWANRHELETNIVRVNLCIAVILPGLVGTAVSHIYF
jgi:hypothetical protein